MKRKRFLRLLLFIFLFMFLLSCIATAHSGRTDGSGGHRDGQNRSGLGSYHYHCGGHPPHLHNGGVCPYDPSDPEQEEPSENLFESLFIDDDPVDPPIRVTGIKISSPKGDSLYVGEEITLSATISPKDADNKTISWQSSDPHIASVDSRGKVTAKNAGKVQIAATASGGASDRYELTVHSYIWWWFWGFIVVVIIAGIIARFLYERSNL